MAREKPDAPESNGQSGLSVGDDGVPVLTFPGPDVADAVLVDEAPAAEQAEAPPVAVDPAADHESLRRITEADAAVAKAERKMADAKRAAKLATESYELAISELRRAIREANDPQLPLPFGDAPAPPAAPEPASADDGRSTPIEALGLTDGVASILRAAGLRTVGSIGKWTAGGKPLTAIEAEIDGRAKRITEARAEQIVAALDRYWADREPAQRVAEGWRFLSVGDLAIPTEQALALGDAGIATLGQLADRIASTASLDEIDGIDTDAAGEIAQALDDFRAGWPQDRA